MRCRSEPSYYDLVSSRQLSDIDGVSNVNENSLYSNLICTGILAAHTGCVNALDWSESGYLLASGSDDQKLGIWSIDGHSPKAVNGTVHSQNIFGVRFLPTFEDKIITVAGDGKVQYHQVREDGTTASISVWHSHNDRVKRIDAHSAEPNIFLTASEDGTIRQFDIRQSNGDSKLLANWSEQQISLNTLSISPLRPWYVACAGTGPIVRIIDRRMITDERLASSTQYLYDRVWMPVQKNSDMVCALRFRKNSMELIGSLIHDNIYLLNFDEMRKGQMSSETNPVYLRKEEAAYAQLMLKWQSGKHEDYYFAISQVIMQHKGLQYASTRYLDRLLAYEIHSRILCAIHLNRMDEALEDALDLWENLAEFDPQLLAALFLVFALFAEFTGLCDEIVERYEALEHLKSYLDEDRNSIESQLKSMDPIIITETQEWKSLLQQSSVCFNSVQRYSGHVNAQTVKDVAFVGSHDEYIASGSDGGFFFIWNHSGTLLFIGRSDQHVVNCVVQHPKLPLLAVSGIDSDIKLWEPGDINNPDQVDDWRPIPTERRAEFLERLQRMDREFPVITVPCPVQ